MPTDKKEPTLADVLAAVGGIANRVDAIGARVDAMEEKKDAFPEDLKKKDADEEDEKKKKADAEAAAKKDAEEKEEKEKAEEEKKDGETTPEASKKDGDKKDNDMAEEVAADAKKDALCAKADAAAAVAENAALRKRLAAVEAKLPQDRSDDDHRSMASSQARADAVYELFGKQAPRFQLGESNGEYRRRLVRTFAEHSPSWKAVDVGALPDAAFEVAEAQIYADASVAAKDATGVEDGGLRMVQGTTSSGHKKIEFFGHPSAWMNRFGGSRRYATRINPNTKREAV